MIATLRRAMLAIQTWGRLFGHFRLAVPITFGIGERPELADRQDEFFRGVLAEVWHP